jgi:hypothetical protein
MNLSTLTLEQISTIHEVAQWHQIERGKVHLLVNSYNLLFPHNQLRCTTCPDLLWSALTSVKQAAAKLPLVHVEPSKTKPTRPNHGEEEETQTERG